MYQLAHPDLDVLQKRMSDWNRLGQQFPIFENKKSAEKNFRSTHSSSLCRKTSTHTSIT